MKKRLHFIDAIKGLAVLTIIFYHAVPSGTVKTFFLYVTNAALCLFFFTSGYFFNPDKNDLVGNIKKKAGALLKPFLTYGITLWFMGSVYLLISGKETFLEAIYCLRNFFAGCMWNRSIQNLFSLEYYSLGSRYPFLAVFWFLLTMFLAYVLLFLSAKFACRSNKRIVLTAVVFLIIGGVFAPYKDYIPYNLHTAFYFCAFMLFGLLSRRCGFPEKSLLPKYMQYAAAVLAIAASLAIPYANLYENGSGLFRGSFGSPEFIGMAVISLCGLLFIYGMMRIFYRLENDGVRINEMSWLGENSIELFLLHNFVFFLINIPTGLEIGGSNQATDLKAHIASIAVACIAIGICSIFVIVKKKLKKPKAAI